MRLKFDPPENLQGALADAVYCIPCDMDFDGAPCDGVVAIVGTELLTYADGALLQRIDVSLLSELTIHLGVGCAEFVAEIDGGQPYLIARFTRKHSERFAELARAIRIRNEHNTWIEESDDDERVCFKCGRQLIRGSNICPFCSKKGSVFGKMFKMLRPYVPTMVLVITLYVVSSGISISMPIINRVLVDDYLAPQRGPLYEALLLVGAIFACHILSTFVRSTSCKSATASMPRARNSPVKRTRPPNPLWRPVGSKSTKSMPGTPLKNA